MIGEAALASPGSANQNAGIKVARAAEAEERTYRAAKDSENNVYLESDTEELGSDGSQVLSRTAQKAYAKEIPG